MWSSSSYRIQSLNLLTKFQTIQYLSLHQELRS